ncbi:MULTISPECIES: metal-dependent transcriptional regulator [Streptococcus]|uniref:metal-dependent transcriptional regulator n=1 Tax=Streptococcus TaxID=1301 RepID=UPI001F251ADB|nr:metal-dependent transcriptional regulator [Streptococcus halichoeri]MDG3210802.1 metal-dependent transcriptional regulator [Streptococcus suis]MDG3218383.1 metal-dependent transcriptional regulator [Streptococcus suis]
MMHRVYLVENYLENIYILSLENIEVRHKDLTEKMNRAKSVVTKAIHILEEKGYVIYDEDKIIRLTEKGRSIAERVYEKHVYIENLLLEAGVNKYIAESEACDIEHVISDESFEKIKKYIEKLSSYK